MKRQKIKLFSHNDLDGYGCNIILKALLDKDIDCENLNHDEINIAVEDFIKNKEYRNYNQILITDISINEEVAETINNLVKKGYNFKLIDHHKTALDLNKYDWCKVIIEDDVEKVCGTSLLYDYILNNFEINISQDNYLKNITKLVCYIKLYDTWLWKEKYNDINAKYLNDLFYILNPIFFEEELIKYKYSADNFLKENFKLIQLNQLKIDRYIDEKDKEIIPKKLNINNKIYNIGIVFAEQYTSELGNTLSSIHQEYDLIAIIKNNTISYRTIKENIDVSEIAKFFNGGGHPKASGSTIRKEVKENYINEIFKI